MNELSYIRAEALSIETGVTRAVYCPFCDNESPYSPSLSITRTDEGIVYNCYRAVCSGKGFIGSMPRERVEKVTRKPTTNQFKESTQLLSEEQKKQLFGEYNLSDRHCATWRVSYGRLVMPMRDDKGNIWGYNSKSMWDVFPGSRKSVNYVHIPYEGGVHWATDSRHVSDKVVVVEDIISATRVAATIKNVHVIALLGTVFNDHTVKALMGKRIKHVVIALDPDALSKAVSIVNKYRVFFNTFKILSLSKDPKDLSKEKFHDEMVRNIL